MHFISYQLCFFSSSPACLFSLLPIPDPNNLKKYGSSSVKMRCWGAKGILEGAALARLASSITVNLMGLFTATSRFSRRQNLLPADRRRQKTETLNFDRWKVVTLTGGKWSLLFSEVDILACFQICDVYPYTDVKFNVIQNASSWRGEKLSRVKIFDLLRRPRLAVAR